MATNLSWDWRIWVPTSPGLRNCCRHCRPRRYLPRGIDQTGRVCPEREDVSLDLEAKACPCCGGTLHTIGETVSEMLDWVPARLRVIRIRRPKYGCRACGSIHQASAPE